MKQIIYLLLLLLILTGCKQVVTDLDGPALIDQAKPDGEYSEPGLPLSSSTDTETPVFTKLEVFFTNPENLFPGDYSGGIDQNLVNAIDSARMSVDMAIYNINLWSIRDALIRAYQRGIPVRIVMESDNLEDEVPRQLISAGIRIIGDRREGLMHNKFVVIDSEDVWTGSANYSIGGFYYDNNNLVHLHSYEIAKNFTTEFEEMFVRDMFGSDIVAETPFSQVQLGNTLVEVYFSPDDHVSEYILELLNNSRESIFFLAYSFTANNLGDAIVEKFNSGIIVEGIMDGTQMASNSGTEFDLFQMAGINVQVESNAGLMHHKVIIIDRQIVITGSYNFSKNAELFNDENIIVIHDQGFAKEFLDEFDRIKLDRTK